MRLACILLQHMHSGETRPLRHRVPLAVVIPTWNGQRTIAACLAPLGSLGAAELLLVDNASTDRTREIACGSAPAARLIALPRNGGFAAACNRGIRATVAPCILLLNQDAVIDPPGIRALLAALTASPRAAAAGGRIKDPDGSLQPSMGPSPHPFRVALDRIPGVHRLVPTHVYRQPRRYDRPHAPTWLSGACLLLRRTAWDDVGPFDERYFMYTEDLDWCTRAWRRGWEIHYVPVPVAVHADGGRRPEHAVHKARWMREGLLRYFDRHGTPAQGRLFRFLLTAERFLRLPGALEELPKDHT